MKAFFHDDLELSTKNAQILKNFARQILGGLRRLRGASGQWRAWRIFSAIVAICSERSGKQGSLSESVFT
jgi:hypothetical protein